MKTNEQLSYASPQVEAVELTLGNAILTGSQQQAKINDPTASFSSFDWEEED